jgi:hypothetical protein
MGKGRLGRRTSGGVRGADAEGGRRTGVALVPCPGFCFVGALFKIKLLQIFE